VDPWSIVSIAAGYLIGSVGFGAVVPRIRGVDIYSVGSGNPGASNVLRSMGKSTAAVVLVGDLLKGFGAAALGGLAGGATVGCGAGLAAVIGHCYPIWHRFRGGKGVATAGGMTIWLEPMLGLILMAMWVVITLVAKRASVASLLLAVLLVPGLVLFGTRGWSLAWAGGAALLVLYRHRGNLLRLLRGTEHTIEGSPA
jgi:glycerol-3-phosphate acyltransferase PlsY